MESRIRKGCELWRKRMSDKQYKVTLTEEQYQDYLEHLTYPPNIQDVKKPNKKEFGEENKHPTIKPVKMMEWLVKLLTDEGDIVLDCFMGSGTTGVACKNLDREFVGIEKSKEFVKTAKRRGVK